jgi:hypothetical protein
MRCVLYIMLVFNNIHIYSERYIFFFGRGYCTLKNVGTDIWGLDRITFSVLIFWF